MNSEEIKAWQDRLEEHSTHVTEPATGVIMAILEVALQLALLNEHMQGPPERPVEELLDDMKKAASPVEGGNDTNTHLPSSIH